jgi:methylenetetrahydrofolate reductase (NADPH)
MQVSLEVVPRSDEALRAAAAVAAQFPEISAINVPDLLRFPIRSWDACAILAHSCTEDEPFGKPADAACRFNFIPHLRAIDFDPDRPFPYAEELRNAGVKRVLAVAGDPPQDMKRHVFPTSTIDFIRKLKTELPEIEIYAAFDPYRSNIRYELDYLRAKEDAGADGFMSQPFFDLRLLEIYAEYLEGRKIFWGVSPVVSGPSRDYWEARNRAVFPRAFRPTLDWNIDFGRRVLDFCRRDGFDVYLMPIKVAVPEYLRGLFA